MHAREHSNSSGEWAVLLGGRTVCRLVAQASAVGAHDLHLHRRVCSATKGWATGHRSSTEAIGRAAGRIWPATTVVRMLTMTIGTVVVSFFVSEMLRVFVITHMTVVTLFIIELKSFDIMLGILAFSLKSSLIIVAAHVGGIALHDAVTNAVGPCLLERTNKGREVSVVWQRYASYDMDAIGLGLQFFDGFESQSIVGFFADTFEDLLSSASVRWACSCR